MTNEEVLAAARAAAALHSTIAGISAASADSTFSQLGIANFDAYRADLHRLLTTAHEQPLPLAEFAGRLPLTSDTKISQVASAAAPLVQPVIVCDQLNPGDDPDQTACQLWMFKSFFCRVKLAVKRWAKPEAVPSDGITPELQLGELVPHFDTLERKRLVRTVNEDKVFQPYPVTAGDPGAGLVDATTTVQGFAKVLWDHNRTPCSIMINFPREG